MYVCMYACMYAYRRRERFSTFEIFSPGHPSTRLSMCCVQCFEGLLLIP